MTNQKQELNPSDIIACIGQSVTDQKIFKPNELLTASKDHAETYFPILISKTLQKPERFSLFSIPVDELHIKVDDKDIVVAVFIKLDNQQLVKKMEKYIGDEYMASGISANDEPPLDSYFIWDFKGGCVSLILNANKVQFTPRIVRDNGLVTFYNCDMLSYLNVPKDAEH